MEGDETPMTRSFSRMRSTGGVSPLTRRGFVSKDSADILLATFRHSSNEDVPKFDDGLSPTTMGDAPRSRSLEVTVKQP